MSDTEPTLKIRLKLPDDYTYLGRLAAIIRRISR